MQVLPITGYTKKPAFLGYTVEDTPRGCSYPETHLNAAKRTERRYEKTLGTFHSNPTYKIYYADPLEKINDSLREKVDYIFYDDEPRFPLINEEISKVYFEDPKPFGNRDLWDYKQEIEKYKQYFYRMEMSDSKFAGHYYNQLMNKIDIHDSKEKLDYYNARIADAKYNQETAGICINIMNEADGKINYKNKLRRDISHLDYQIKDRHNDSSLIDKELENRKKLNVLLETRLKNLKSRQSAYTEFVKQLEGVQKETEEGLNFTKEVMEQNHKSLPELAQYNAHKEVLTLPAAEQEYRNTYQILSADETFEKKELSLIKSRLRIIKESIDSFTTLYDKNQIYIKKATDYKINLPKIIAEIEAELKQKKSEFEKVKADLIPLFDKLKNYFYTRGLKQVKY